MFMLTSVSNAVTPGFRLTYSLPVLKFSILNSFACRSFSSSSKVIRNYPKILKPQASDEILLSGHPVLSRKARPVLRNMFHTTHFSKLIGKMRWLLNNKEVGIGLSAPQIGVPLQVCAIQFKKKWLDDDAMEVGVFEQFPLTFLINPFFLPSTASIPEDVLGYEMCLSVPDFEGLVPRRNEVHVRAFDEQGKQFDLHTTGWMARAIQHEMDHLNGILFTERMVDGEFFSSDDENSSQLHLSE